MAKKFASTLTEQGKTLIAAAIAGGDTLKLKYLAVGDGNGATVTPTSDQTALVNEVARVEINSLKETDATKQTIAAEAIIPAATGGFWMREVGIFTEDGTLIACSQMPETYKPDAADGAASTQTLRLLLDVSDTSVVNLTVDDSIVIATEDYVNSQLTAHEKSRNHPDGTLTAKGFVQLSNAIDSDSEALAATAKAVKSANDNADSRLKAESNLSDVADASISLSNLGGVPTTRKINSKALSADITLSAGDVSAFPAEGGTVGSKGVTTPGFHVTSSGLAASIQGMYLGWNEQDGQGEGDIIINPGSGGGGLIIRGVNSDNSQNLWTITIGGDGSLSTSGQLLEMGQRPYGPNNPPPIASSAITGFRYASSTWVAVAGSDWTAPSGTCVTGLGIYTSAKACYSYAQILVNGQWLNVETVS